MAVITSLLHTAERNTVTFYRVTGIVDTCDIGAPPPDNQTIAVSSQRVVLAGQFPTTVKKVASTARLPS